MSFFEVGGIYCRNLKRVAGLDHIRMLRFWFRKSRVFIIDSDSEENEPFPNCVFTVFLHEASFIIFRT